MKIFLTLLFPYLSLANDIELFQKDAGPSQSQVESFLKKELGGREVKVLKYSAQMFSAVMGTLRSSRNLYRDILIQVMDNNKKIEFKCESTIDPLSKYWHISRCTSAEGVKYETLHPMHSKFPDCCQQDSLDYLENYKDSPQQLQTIYKALKSDPNMTWASHQCENNKVQISVGESSGNYLVELKKESASVYRRGSSTPIADIFWQSGKVVSGQREYEYFRDFTATMNSKPLTQVFQQLNQNRNRWKLLFPGLSQCCQGKTDFCPLQEKSNQQNNNKNGGGSK